MSGGVDSSLAAALLLKQGYDVFGLTMLLSDTQRDVKASTNLYAPGMPAGDASLVAEKIGIPHYVVDFKTIFQKKVIDSFINEYFAGHTPNPCVVCNPVLKFGALLDKAKQMGADYLATGHYASIEHDEKTGRFSLARGKDIHKDQSYALYGIPKERLSEIIFPLGKYTKEETRRLAAELKLPVADKPESQEICFVPADDYKSFLKQHCPGRLQEGDIVDVQGHVLGRHQGIALYTIGQRHGLNIASTEPLYVLCLDTLHNQVIVGSNKELFANGLIAHSLNWLSLDKLEDELHVLAKIRYGSTETPAMLVPLEDNQVKVIFAEAQRAITPGQSVVFYDGTRLLGGGIIDRAI